MTLEAVAIAAVDPTKMSDELLPPRVGHVVEVIEARRILQRLRPCLMSDQPLAAIRDAEIDAGELRKLRLQLAEEPMADIIDGDMSDDAISRRLDAIDRPERRAMLAIVAAVLREIEAPRCCSSTAPATMS